MPSKKSQSKAGRPPVPRGQETGKSKARLMKDDTPAIHGRRTSKNKMNSDPSTGHVASSPARPQTNFPSTPAVIDRKKVGSTAGGEKVFKQRSKKAKT
jgi:hypothetical protein